MWTLRSHLASADRTRDQQSSEHLSGPGPSHSAKDSQVPPKCGLGDGNGQLFREEWEPRQITEESPASRALKLGKVLSLDLLETKCFLFSVRRGTEVFVPRYRCRPGGPCPAGSSTNKPDKVRHPDLPSSVQEFLKMSMLLW